MRTRQQPTAIPLSVMVSSYGRDRHASCCCFICSWSTNFRVPARRCLQDLQHSHSNEWRLRRKAACNDEVKDCCHRREIAERDKTTVERIFLSVYFAFKDIFPSRTHTQKTVRGKSKYVDSSVEQYHNGGRDRMAVLCHSVRSLVRWLWMKTNDRHRRAWFVEASVLAVVKLNMQKRKPSCTPLQGFSECHNLGTLFWLWYALCKGLFGI